MIRKICSAIAIMLLFSACAYGRHAQAGASLRAAHNVSIINLGEGNMTTAGDYVIHLSGSDGRTLQNAISVIPSGGVIITSGDFIMNHTLQIGKNVTITSPKGSKLTGNGTKGLADLKGNITLENLTFEGGGGEDAAGGLYITGSENVTLKNCVIRSCSADICGGGLYIDGSAKVTMDNCTVQNCRAGCYGGGICTSEIFSGVLEMTACNIIENNVSGYENYYYGWGGGICFYSGNLLLYNCKVQQNYAYYYAGGVFIGENVSYAGADAQCVISGNVSEYTPQFADIYNNSGAAASSILDGIDIGAEASGSGCSASGMGYITLAAVLFFVENIKHNPIRKKVLS